MAKKIARVLNMKKLLADALKGKFGLQIPEHFIEQNQNFTPGTAEEKLEDALVAFFTTYLNTSTAPESIKNIGTAQPEIVKINCWNKFF